MMNTSTLWIIFPSLMAMVLLILRRWMKITWIVSLITAVLLTLFTFVLPFSGGMQIFHWSFTIQDRFPFFGRELVLGEAERMTLTMLYGGLALWLVPLPLIKERRLFPGISLGLVALLTTIIAIKPFLFASMLIELSVLLCMPILAVAGQPVNKGVLRFLSMVTLSVPCILYAGWIMSRVEVSATQPEMITRAAVLMGIGFVFLLGIFPFHSWLPMMLNDLPPYITTFIIFLHTTIVCLFGIGLINNYVWLKESPLVHIVIVVVGALIVFIAGLLALSQMQFGRILGYVIMAENGYSLIAIGLSFEIGLSAFYALLIPRVLALGLYAFSLNELKNYRDELSFHALEGAAQYAPWACIGILFAFLSLIGFPPLAAYSSRFYLWEVLAGANFFVSLFVFVGSIGLLGAGFRMVSVLFTQNVSSLKIQSLEPLIFKVIIGVGTFGLLVIGLVPQWINPFLANLMRLFNE